MGLRWGITFLRTASHLSAEARTTFLTDATAMYLLGETERQVRGPEYEGRLYTQGRYELIAEMGGVRFDAEVETDKGRDRLAFLVCERTQATKAYSRN